MNKKKPKMDKVSYEYFAMMDNHKKPMLYSRIKGDNHLTEITTLYQLEWVAERLNLSEKVLIEQENRRKRK